MSISITIYLPTLAEKSMRIHYKVFSDLPTHFLTFTSLYL